MNVPRSIEILLLNDNQITELATYSFFEKPKLRRVDLTVNRLTAVEKKSLRLSPDLVAQPQFLLGGNPIECFREQTFTPLAHANPLDFLCSYQTHCFALCHCCNYGACNCEMACPDPCSCYHDNTWTCRSTSPSWRRSRTRRWTRSSSRRTSPR
jgi:hypothetical protein